MNASTLTTREGLIGLAQGEGLIGLAQGVGLILTTGLPWAAAEDTGQAVGIFPLIWRTLADGTQTDVSAIAAVVLMAAVVIGAAAHMVAKLNGQSGIVSASATLAVCLGLLMCSGVFESLSWGWGLTMLVAAVEPVRTIVTRFGLQGYIRHISKRTQ